MNPEALRAHTLLQLDSLLGRWVISTKERAALTGLRAYVSGAMTVEELTKLGGFMPATYLEVNIHDDP